MTTLREAAQQALEAMESYRNMMFVEAGCRFKEGEAAITALRAALTQPEPEPDIYPDEAREMGLEEVALYTHPPRREWQGLTDEDMEDLLPLYSDPGADAEMLEFAAAIEAKLKEKNNG